MRKAIIGSILIIFIGGGFWYWLSVRTENSRELFSGSQNVEILDDGIVVLGVKTEAKTVGEFVKQINLNLKAEDKIYPSKEVELIGATRIIVERAIPIKIEVDGKTVEKNVFTKNIKDTLLECDVTLNPSDKVEPELDEGIFEDIEIIVTRIDHKEVTETEDIDFKVVERKDKNLKWRTKKVKQQGEKGEKEVKYLVTYKNGKEVKRKKLSTEIVKEPVDEVTVVGTKIKVGKKQKGLATWYAYTGRMAAASITFPKGTWLRVTAVNSGKQVFVVINDYGPAAYTGKILDLDKEAFKKIAPLGAGVVEVKIEEIK